METTKKVEFILNKVYERRLSSASTVVFDFIPKKRIGNKIEWVIKIDGKIVKKGISAVKSYKFVEKINPRGFYAIFAN